MRLTPKKLHAMQKGFKSRFEYIDRYVWQAVGNYGMSALITALDAGFNGRKAQAKYINDPILLEKEEVIELTEEEFEALPPEEQEKIIMRMFGEAMEDTVNGFEKKKAEGEKNG